MLDPRRNKHWWLPKMITKKFLFSLIFKVHCNKIWTSLFCSKPLKRTSVMPLNMMQNQLKILKLKKHEGVVFCLKLHCHLIEIRDLRNAWLLSREKKHTLVNNVNSSSYVIYPSPFLSIHLKALSIESLFRGFSFLIMSQKSLYDILSVQKTKLKKLWASWPDYTH